jgi:predicted short-subunit dehydrogenase-like oxidoreductase (DUF2520 family)
MSSGIAFAGVGTHHPQRAATLLPPDLIATPEAIARHAGLIWLAVPDGVLERVARDLPWRDGQWVAHLAGSLPASAIAGAVAPATAAAFHPLAALPRSGAPADIFNGKVIGLDAPPDVLPGLQALARRLGAQPIVVPPEARAAYHLAATMTSNLTVALVAEATDVWRSAGLDTSLALPALLPLLTSTRDNLLQLGLPDALTGPIARGDIATVRRHLEALAGMPDEITSVYCALGLRSVAIARDQGRIDPATLDAIADLLR